MDVYILDRKIKPFYQMCLVELLEIPIIKNKNEKLTIQKVNKLCEEILLVNRLIFSVVRKINSINQFLLEKENSPDR